MRVAVAKKGIWGWGSKKGQVGASDLINTGDTAGCPAPGPSLSLWWGVLRQLPQTAAANKNAKPGEGGGEGGHCRVLRAQGALRPARRAALNITPEFSIISS